MSFIHQAIEWYFQQMNNIGLELYVFLGMLIESSFIPFPSEVIMPPAAHQAGGFMRVVGLIILGTAGSLLGGLFNYYVGYFLGRPFFEKYGKYLLINHKKLEQMDRFWEKYGEASTFIGRLVPAVRQVISVPAGFARMNIWKFSLYTSLGAGFWVTVLAMLGWFLRDWTSQDFEQKLKGAMMPYVLGGLAVLIVGYLIKIKCFGERKETVSDGE